MAESIEAFVAKLQQEGVQAGKQAADKLLEKAHADAERVAQEAQAKARKITEDAEAQAKATLERSRTDLALAARDTALRLREALTRAVRMVLATRAQQSLQDAEFLKGVLHDVIMQYVQADLDGQTTIRINVSSEMQRQLTEWALAHLHQKAEQANLSLDLKGTLSEAGFEYEVEGANVEVTLDSVVEALGDLVNPALREMLQKALEPPAS